MIVCKVPTQSHSTPYFKLHLLTTLDHPEHAHDGWFEHSAFNVVHLVILTMIITMQFGLRTGLKSKPLKVRKLAWFIFSQNEKKKKNKTKKTNSYKVKSV